MRQINAHSAPHFFCTLHSVNALTVCSLLKIWSLIAEVHNLTLQVSSTTTLKSSNIFTLWFIKAEALHIKYIKDWLFFFSPCRLLPVCIVCSPSNSSHNRLCGSWPSAYSSNALEVLGLMQLLQVFLNYYFVPVQLLLSSYWKYPTWIMECCDGHVVAGLCFVIQFPVSDASVLQSEAFCAWGSQICSFEVFRSLRSRLSQIPPHKDFLPTVTTRKNIFLSPFQPNKLLIICAQMLKNIAKADKVLPSREGGEHLHKNIWNASWSFELLANVNGFSESWLNHYVWDVTSNRDH